jgi:hypothetical protein
VRLTFYTLLFASIAGTASAQPANKSAPPLHAQSASTLNFTTAADGTQTLEIHNVDYEIAGPVPGRPTAELLVLRKTVQSKQVLGDIGEEATVTLESWPLGQDLRQKPLYAVTVSGNEGHAVDSALFVVSRGLEEVEWWSAYKLGSGQHLFDTYVPLVKFSIARDTVKTRYAGLEIPEDDTKDARLKQPNVVAVLTYASEDRVIREALLTCDNAQKAALLRSLADATRTLSLVEDPSQPTRTLKLYISEDFPSPSNAVEVRIPVRNDDLDLAHAQLPAGLHLAAWKR